MVKNTHHSDLSLTIQELSNTYEELSLLYRISSSFSSLSVDEICDRIADEAVDSLGVKTAAVLFLDRQKKQLYTKTGRGAWDLKRVFRRDNQVLWNVIESKKAFAYCNVHKTKQRDYFPELSSLLVCPILGKTNPLGLLVVADKETKEEFYSNDSKLLMAIALQAGLFMENAFLYRELETLLLGAISSLVKALEASSKWTAGHTERVTQYSVSVGRALGLDKESIEKLRITALLHDIGKIATPKEILNKKRMLDEKEWLEIRKHPSKGAEILMEFKQFEDIILSIKYHHECWDGNCGNYGLREEEIPLMARILSVADTFDALTSNRPYKKKKSKNDAVEEIVRCSGTQFDPAVVEAFLQCIDDFILQH